MKTKKVTLKCVHHEHPTIGCEVCRPKYSVPKKPVTKRDKHFYEMAKLVSWKATEKILDDTSDIQPKTKRDRHFYDMGAEQQAKVFNDKDWSKFSPRKEILNDYQEQISSDDKLEKVSNCLFLLVLFVLFFLAFHEVIMWVLN